MRSADVSATASGLHLRAGAAAEGGDPVVVTPERAGWRYTGLRVVRLAAGDARELTTDGVELAVLPLGGGAALDCDGRRLVLRGRETVFSAVTDWAYVPPGRELRLVSEHGCELALCTAPASRPGEPRRVAADEVQVERRGGGASSRRIVNFMSPEGFPDAERLVCVEVFTEAGHTSSYPPHKHDDSPECPVELEEIYYFRVGRTGSASYSTEGFGLHRTYTDDRSIDETVEVRDGDVFLVPRGYHGPCVALPGYPLYYLNVLAGPGEERSLAFVDDPAHAWIRGTWPQQGWREAP